MLSILAIIGLIVVLWLASKGLTKIGDNLVRFGDSLMDIAARMHKEDVRTAEDLKDQLDRMENKIGSVKGDEDAEYLERVRKEIDDLTGSDEN